MKRIVINVIVSQLLIILLLFVLNGEATLLDYINVSFNIGSALLFMGLAVLVFQSGFFDFFSTSMKKVFYRKHVQEDIMTMRPPSEVITIKPNFFFRLGVPVILLMLVALLVYSI
ncbi:DUF3899 domain-containing protein [Sporosarcina thermotolerans]|uniref:DUF3899 domain-containing protein n=1 Tax=Sporosarcina thermotolerans TaxID=633404 RepID=A0AAW9AB75_9BACL|nr:DUF3899 domain-containing protein [Sporosarcina thermotolerans]MDW0117250.1 DUF3899 domain-containing protein [Sporosarcina thermotolerans]WHT47415.1 DUF3899 domain-containing protein [Sporosarcina thermotolerans]